MKPTIKTPEQVKDALFYRVFPDRFARSAQNAWLVYLEPWDTSLKPDGGQGR